MDKIEGTSMDITKENIEKLKELFPNCVTEGKIDFDMLQIILGEEVDTGREKYQFTWNGKNAAIKLAQAPSSSTLRPCKEKSKNWDTTQNLYIEGDNLEVLKQLQKTYYGKIKLIYIDPPYNTGKEFVYKDDLHDSIANYIEQTNQETKSNPETNGRFHTDWLNMIFPRLILAKNLLTDDGVIFISIDDHENANLVKICNEVFGENCFVCSAIWRSSDNSNNDAKQFSTDHNYTLIYSKKPNWEPAKVYDDSKRKHFKNPDNDPRGPWFDGNPLNSPNYRENLCYTITAPNGNVIQSPKNGWRWSKETMDEKFRTGEIYFNKDQTNIKRRTYLADMQGLTPSSLWADLEMTGHNRQAKYELLHLMGDEVFDTPKPVKLIKYIISLLKENCDAIVLDFFSGSGTTAEAVMQLNKEDNGNRQFIMVQLPENLDLSLQTAPKDKREVIKNAIKLCDKNGVPHVLSEVARERIKKAGEKIKKEWEEANQEEGLFADEAKEFPVDIGFKVFKLDSTNINPWDNEQVIDDDNLFDTMADVFKPDRSKEDILYEIMLKYGVFDMPVTEIELNGKTMYRVGTRYMLVCLEDKVTEKDIIAIGNEKPRVVIFNEAGFANDNDKINAVYNLEKAGVEDVKCI